MKCRGSHKGLHEHDTVAEVRACYGQPQTTPRSSDGWQDYGSMAGSYVDSPKRKLPKIHEPNSLNVESEDTFTTAPHNPYNIPGPQDWAKFKQIPAGYYATPSLTGNNDLDFWKVEKGKGRWDGYTFVKRVIGGHDDADIPRDSKKRVKTQRVGEKVTQARALAAIVDFGVQKSHERFGVELKYCRECGIHLTDELSRDLGIGPVCRDK
jgi:hypothetical protein